MNHLPKIGTVSARLNLLPLYEPLTKLFYMRIVQRVPSLRRGAGRAHLFFRPETPSAGTKNYFIDKTEIERHSHDTFNIYFAPKVPKDLFGVSASATVRTVWERGMQTVAAPKAPDLFVTAPRLHKMGANVEKSVRHDLIHMLEERMERFTQRVPGEKESRLHYLKERRVEIGEGRDRIVYAESPVGQVPEPVTLHYRRESSAKRSQPEAKSERESVKVTLHNIEKESLNESKEVHIERIKEIERISEKVYTLVMKKWEQERRRRGVLYE